MDRMLGSNHFEREKSKLSNSVRRPKSLSYNAVTNHDSNSHSNSRENEIRVFPETAKTREKLILAAKSIDCLGNCTKGSFEK